jgi:hypothetical protein
MYLAGAVATPDLTAALAREIVDVLERLQASATCRGAVGSDCTLRDRLDDITSRWRALGKLGEELGPLAERLGEIVRLLEWLVEDGRATALTPPCPAPGDTAVLLARVEVDRCKVLRITNAVRAYVLAPTTLRHWGAIRTPDPAGGWSAGAPAPDLATVASELAALRRSYAALEQRLAELEAEHLGPPARPPVAQAAPAAPAAPRGTP